MRFATYEHRTAPCRRRAEDGTLHPLPGVSSLTGLLAEAAVSRTARRGLRDARRPAGPHVSEVRLLPPLQPPTVRDFVTFEEHVEGVRRSMDGAAGVPERGTRPRRSTSPTRYAITAPHDDIPVPPGSRACSTSSWRSPP